MQTIKNLLNRLRADALYGKNKHFSAADRKAGLSNWLQIPALVINAVLASVLFNNIQKETPTESKWISAALALLAAIFTALTTYLKLDKQVEGHRKVANKYLKVAKACERTLAAEADGFLEGLTLIAELEKWASMYEEANIDAEAYTTNARDLVKARKWINSGQESYSDKEIEI